MAVIGVVVTLGCRVRPQDSAIMVRAAMASLTVLALGGIAMLLVDPQDIPEVLRTVIAALR
ncbi:hypothetical protein [Streptomyces longwoodensis]|uniref:hypothetical protein n=1 Tax=Streptomyces longwoodensis TaxID=68231 RepID=UPI0033D2150A